MNATMATEQVFSHLNEALPLEAASDLAWLGDRERCELDALRDPGRRQQWLAGRWLAKKLVSDYADCRQLSRIQILSRDDRGRGVRPRVVVESQEWPWSLSIAHSDQSVAIAAADLRCGVVGIDVAAASLQADDGFCHLWFTPRERQWGDRDRSQRYALLWAIKEAVYKAINNGQAWSPREIEVCASGSSRFECCYRGRKLGRLNIELSARDDQVVAIVFLPRANATTRAVQEQFSRGRQAASGTPSRVHSSRFVNCSVRGSHVH